jgi:Glycosyltransferase like family 2
MTEAPLPVTGSIPVARGALVAVVVTRGVTSWLPTTLAAVAAQTRAPTRVLVVDVAPRPDRTVGELPTDDPVARLARRALDDVAPLWTLAAPGARTFGDAVRQALSVPGAAPAGVGLAADRNRRPRTGAVPAVGTGLALGAGSGDRAGGVPRTGGTTLLAGDQAAPRTGSIPTVGGPPPEVADWLWLLHDDSAPEPDALSELVRAVEHAPSVGIAGAKQRSWADPARLLEVGLTTSRLGRRMTGVEDGEVDQGQHDGRDDVLGVGLAGALVRRDVWDALDGPDPALGPFGDGLDLSRRARLAGHRVVVVPRAVVRHAQATYAGLRDDDLRHVLTGAAIHDAPGQPPAAAPTATRVADPRRSFAARRRAHVHARLAAVPLPLLPVQTVLFLLAAIGRSLLRIASKDGVLAAAELAAPVVAILHPARMARSRAAARRARRLPRRSLRVLQTSWRDVVREERDRALTRAEARRVVQAPSELELAELAALATRRRAGLAALAVGLLGLTVAVLGPLVVAVARGDALVGGGLLPVGADVGGLWRALTAGWVPAGLGVAAPGDPLWAVLLPLTAIAGDSARVAVALVVLGAPLVAGLGAWFAAGAATRSVAVRLWSAAVWALAPALMLAIDGGRLGAVVAHLALPWVALGVARALGVQRGDVVVPGLVDARAAGHEASGAG